MGRGHDADIRITDISVSRSHASIRYEKDSFFIEDNNSKFGTLVLVKAPIPLTKDISSLAVQIGRSVLSFTLKKTWKLLSVCFGYFFISAYLYSFNQLKC